MGWNQITEGENEQGNEENQFIWWISINCDKSSPLLETQRLFFSLLFTGRLFCTLVQYQLRPPSLGWGGLQAPFLGFRAQAGLDGNKPLPWLRTLFYTFCWSHSLKSPSHVSFSVYTGILIRASILIIPMLLFLSQIFMRPLPFYRASVLLWNVWNLWSTHLCKKYQGLSCNRDHIWWTASPVLSCPRPGHCTCGLWQSSVSAGAPSVAFVLPFQMLKSQTKWRPQCLRPDGASSQSLAVWNVKELEQNLCSADGSPQLFVQAGWNMCFCLIHVLHLVRSPGVKITEVVVQNCLVPGLILNLNLWKWVLLLAGAFPAGPHELEREKVLKLEILQMSGGWPISAVQPLRHNKKSTN